MHWGLHQVLKNMYKRVEELVVMEMMLKLSYFRAKVESMPAKE